MNKLRIVFMGTPEFAVASLKALLNHECNIVAVVTAPDKPAGRGQLLSQSAVKKFALEHGLKLLQPLKLKDEDFIRELSLLRADLQIVVAFRMLPEAVWSMPPCGTYNLHASLLPDYRGAAPINWAIINGEKQTGVTTFKLQHEIDTGNILFAQKVEIPDTMNAGELHDQLMVAGSALLLKTVDAIAANVFEGKKLLFTRQDGRRASHAPKLFRDTCRIDWNMPMRKIYDLIRGLSPYPAAFTYLVNDLGKEIQLKIYTALEEETEHSYTNGLISTDGKTFLKVYCRGGALKITDLQMEGKRRLRVEDFLRGFEIKKGASLR